MESLMIIYKTTNLINGKIYVGYDTRNKAVYYGSGKIYKQAEKKYGKENFRKVTIDSDADFDELCRKEVFWIDKLDARNPLIGYNLLEGGQGHKGCHSDETKRKISKSNKGKILSDEHRQNIRKALKGNIISEETRQKLSIAKTGENNSMFGRLGENNPNYGKINLNSIMAMKKANTGKHRSLETKLKISAANAGKISPMKGKTHSEETKRKMSESAKRRSSE